MADASGSTGSGALAFLKQKAGPLPVWVWLAGFAVIWWYYERQNSSSTGAASAASSTTGTGYGTDPAGNSGYIDPETGYVYGSAEDIAALQSEGELASNTDASGGSSGTGTYTDDNAWAEAAINYLVARGVDPTTANQAITLYLAGQNLTTEQQADINLAIQGIGAPPQLPGPSSGNPAPVQGTVTVPNVIGKSASAADAAITAAGLVPGAHSTGTGTVNGQTPKGGTSASSGSTVDLSLAGTSSTGTSTGTGTTKTAAKAPAMPGGIHGTPYTNKIDLAWTPVPAATQYRIRATYQSAVVYNGTSSTTHATVTGLSPNRTYTIHVSAGNAAGWSSETNGPAIKTTQ
ncbi:MAG TPA: PASTA domain-containing protein [Trebonia sp.]|jgi:hypothetical protein